MADVQDMTNEELLDELMTARYTVAMDTVSGRYTEQAVETQDAILDELRERLTYYDEYMES